MLPMLMARMGSVPVASSQRPRTPVATAALGDAVCQMSMPRKWLRRGWGSRRPRTTASCLASQRAFSPLRLG